MPSLLERTTLYIMVFPLDATFIPGSELDLSRNCEPIKLDTLGCNNNCAFITTGIRYGCNDSFQNKRLINVHVFAIGTAVNFDGISAPRIIYGFLNARVIRTSGSHCDFR
jgi:hypothetical protein